MKKKFKGIHLFFLIMGIIIFIGTIMLNKCDGSGKKFLSSSESSTNLVLEDIIIPEITPKDNKLSTKNKNFLLSSKNNEDTIIEFYGRNFVVYSVQKE